MRCVLQQQRALAHRFPDEEKVPLPQIAKAAVNEFGAAARSGFGEIALLDQHRTVAPRRGLHGCAQSGRAAADHQKIPTGG